MATIWLTTNWHFNHEKIKEYEGRPNNFADLIIARHNEVIGREDVLVCLGDTIFARKHELKYYLAQFNCMSKILVRGNHDRYFTNGWLERQGFNFVCDSIVVSEVLLSHAPMPLCSGIALINVHGHLHSGQHRQPGYYPFYSSRHVLLGLENTNYYPVKLSDAKNGLWNDGKGVIRL